VQSGPIDRRAFVAEVTLPEPRRLRITYTGIERSSSGAAEWLGWEFVACGLDEAGNEFPLSETWEMTFLGILRYPPGYSEHPLTWRREGDDRAVDLVSLQPEYDASRYGERALKVIMGPGLVERLCFNVYDDGYYRFISEQLIQEGRLSAWIPGEWSSEHRDLTGAEREARKKFRWAR